MICSRGNIHKTEKVKFENKLKKEEYQNVSLKYKEPETEEEKATRLPKKKQEVWRGLIHHFQTRLSIQHL